MLGIGGHQLAEEGVGISVVTPALKGAVSPVEGGLGGRPVDDGDLVGDCVHWKNLKNARITGTQGHRKEEHGNHSFSSIHGILLSPFYQVPWKPKVNVRARGYV